MNFLENVPDPKSKHGTSLPYACEARIRMFDQHYPEHMYGKACSLKDRVRNASVPEPSPMMRCEPGAAG